MPRFSVRALLLLTALAGACTAFVVISMFQYRRSYENVAEIEQLCRLHGGTCIRDLVDGYYIVDLRNTPIGNRELARICALCGSLPTGAIDYSNKIKLLVAGTKIDDSGLGSIADLEDKVVAL